MSPIDGDNSYTDHSISAFDSSPREKEKMRGSDNQDVKMSRSIIKDHFYGLLAAELLASYVIWDLQTYITDVWKLDFTHAAAITNVFTGATKIMPLGMLYLSETCIGQFSMLLSSSIAYCVGFGSLAISTLSGTCGDYKPQKVLYYTSLALIAVGKAGYMTSLRPFEREQRRNRGDDSRGYDPPTLFIAEEYSHQDDDDGEPDSSEHADGLMSCIIFVAALVMGVGAIALLFIKSWPFRFVVPAVSSAFVIVVLLRGTCSYGYAEPGETQALEEQEGTIRSPLIWRFREIAEGAKIIIRMTPSLMTFTLCGIVTSIGNTYFLEQAKYMNPNIGVLRVPVQIHRVSYDAAKSLADNPQFIEFYLLPLLEALPGLGFGIAIISSVLCCITAAAVENGRLALIVKHDGILMSMFWLLPQFFLLGSLEGFAQKSFEGFFAFEVPHSMKRYKNFLAYGVIGAGEIGGALSVYIAGKASEMGGRPSWFQDTLNGSRLDKYYWALAALSSINLVLYVLVAIWYKYRKSPHNEALLAEHLVSFLDSLPSRHTSRLAQAT